MRAAISLIADLNSLQGRKKFPVRMSMELAHNALIYCPFLLPFTRRGALKSMKFPVNSLLAGNLRDFRTKPIAKLYQGVLPLSPAKADPLFAAAVVKS